LFDGQKRRTLNSLGDEEVPVARNPATSAQGLTPRRRTPWWAWFLAAFFLIAFGFNIYSSLMRLASSPGGAVSEAPKGGVLVQKVVAGTPFERAGMLAGDIVVAVNGQAIRTDHDFGEMSWQIEPGKPLIFTVERDGKRIELSVVFPDRRAWQGRSRGQWADYLLGAALPLLYFAMGLVVLLARPYDPGAVAGAFLLLIFGASGFLGPGGGGLGYAVLFRHLPILVQAPVFIVLTLLGGYLLLVFAALWPRPVFRRRWVLPVLLVPGLLMIAYNAIRLYHRFYMPAQAISPGPPWAYKFQVTVEIANTLAGLIVFALGYVRLKDARLRRSLRHVSFAALLTFGGFVVTLAALAGVPFFYWIFESRAAGFVFGNLWYVFPIVFSYTVLHTNSRPASSIANPAPLANP
jgi:hypothetical protein